MTRKQTPQRTRIEPLGDNVVVKPASAEPTTRGGIVLPESGNERPQRGRVLSVGVGRRMANGDRAQPQVVEGDRIVFSPYAGTEIEVNGNTLLIMSETEILAVVG